MKALRHFYRCEDCLTIAVTASRIEPTQDQRGYWHVAECAACGGEVEYMGPVHRQHIQHTEWRCACDGRCTSATGPSCDCQCGGENHGTGAIVEVVTRLEGLPRVMTPSNARVKADVYRELVGAFRAAWDAKYGRVTQEKRQGWRLDGSDYARYCEGQRDLVAFGKAKSLRTHAGRNKRIAALVDGIIGKRVAA